MRFEKIEVGTIREVHRRLSDEGYKVSQNALRIWVKNGTLPAVFVGNKALVAYKNIVKMLISGDVSISDNP